MSGDCLAMKRRTLGGSLPGKLRHLTCCAVANVWIRILVEPCRFWNILIGRCTTLQTNDGGDPVECTPLRWRDVCDLWTVSLE